MPTRRRRKKGGGRQQRDSEERSAASERGREEKSEGRRTTSLSRQAFGQDFGEYAAAFGTPTLLCSLRTVYSEEKGWVMCLVVGAWTRMKGTYSNREREHGLYA